MITRKLIKFFGVKRNGNHPIIYWIVGQGETPSFKWPGHHAPNTKLQKDDIRDFRELAQSGRVGLVLINYENESLVDVDEDAIIPNKKRVLGDVEVEYNVVIVRDVYNMLASYMKKATKCMTMEKGQNILRLWKTHALEYLGSTSHLSSQERVGVCFNKWQLDKRYRQGIAKQLGIEFTDANYQNVPPEGRGSSFDRRSFDGKASQMEIHTRWKQFLETSDTKRVNRYRELLMSSPRALELSNEICGHIPGTENIL